MGCDILVSISRDSSFDLGLGNVVCGVVSYLKNDAGSAR